MFSRPTTRRIRNEKSASQQNVRLLKKLLYIVAELDVCIGSSEAAQNSTDGWSKDGCNASSERLSEPLYREKITSVISHNWSHTHSFYYCLPCFSTCFHSNKKVNWLYTHTNTSSLWLLLSEQSDSESVDHSLHIVGDLRKLLTAVNVLELSRESAQKCGFCLATDLLYTDWRSWISYSGSKNSSMVYQKVNY